MTTIKCSDHPKLQPKEQCGHCGLVAPEFKKCWACQRPMEDWPQAPEIFLMKRGWEQVEPNVWLEPLSRCYGPMPEGVELGQPWKFYKGPSGSDYTNEPMARVSGMIADAEARVLSERKWSASETLKRMQKGAEMLHDGHHDSGGQKVKEGNYRDPQAEAVKSLADAEAELARLIELRDSGAPVKLRDPGRFNEVGAVRHELNLAIPPRPIERHDEPKWTENQIQLMLPASEKARNAPSSEINSNIPKIRDVPSNQPNAGKPRHIFADERRLRQETVSVPYEACPVCRKYQDSYYTKYGK